MHQLEKNIKGITLLEILVVIAIIGVISGFSYPSISDWRSSRIIKDEVQKTASLFQNINAQVQRGQYSYVQVEVDVASAADTVVVVVTSGWGDAVQANKAGLLEIADLFVVNKADRPGASDARRDLELMIDLSQLTGQTVRRPEIVMTTATEGEGLDKFKKAIFEHREFLFEEEQISVRRSKRWKAEVGSRLDYLISEIVKESIENLEEKEGSSPGSVAREIAKNLLKKDELR